MSGTDKLETQPKPAEGARDQKPEAEQGGGQGISPEQPAEGGDDAAPRTSGSPEG